MTHPCFLGIDVGTQGVRAVMLNTHGEVVASAEEAFLLTETCREEQSPLEWWQACVRTLKRLTKKAEGKYRSSNIVSIGVTSTSGTVIPLNRHNKPLHNALMYSDKRSESQALKSTAVARQQQVQGYKDFNSSSGLAKILWYLETCPQQEKNIYRWAHAADFITGMLSGNWGVTDYTSALKSGYDLSKQEWPGYLYTRLNLKKEWLPQVVAPGAVIGFVTAETAGLTGLAPGIAVTAGITDGCASQIASGAIKPGDWNTTIGTTMVIKGVTRQEINDPYGNIYNHKHPLGYWMPGGASNTGADWVNRRFGNDLTLLTGEAACLTPGAHLSWPLLQQGERFPFSAPDARGFEPAGLTRAQSFLAGMEGVAYLERYAYERISCLCGENVNKIYTAGSASNNDLWLGIRSSVLNKPILKMKYITGAVGAAIVAASNTYYPDLIEATEKLTLVEKHIAPQHALVAKYETTYQAFLKSMRSKGYISN